MLLLIPAIRRHFQLRLTTKQHILLTQFDLVTQVGAEGRGEGTGGEGRRGEGGKGRGGEERGGEGREKGKGKGKGGEGEGEEGEEGWVSK